MSWLDRIVVAIVFALVSLMIFGNHAPDRGRRPLPPPEARLAPVPAPAPPPVTPERVRRPPLLQPAATDPLFGVDVEVLKSGSVTLGTAFPVDARGVWLTARHAANASCQQLIMVVDGRRMPASIAFLHPDADLAVVRTAKGAPAVPLSPGPLAIGDTGRSFGYPTGVLGATEDTLMGRTRMQLGGRLSGTGATLTWAEDRRFPDSLETLGGMSGGPMFDDAGRVVGIVVAASVRRGRVHTVAPEMLADAERASGLFTLHGADAGLREVAGHGDALPGAAAALEHAARIVKLYCKVR